MIGIEFEDAEEVVLAMLGKLFQATPLGNRPMMFDAVRAFRNQLFVLLKDLVVASDSFDLSSQDL